MADYPPHGLTAAELATYVTFDADAPNVELAVDAAVDGLRDRAGWHVFPQVSENLTLDGEGGPILVLPTLHVVSVDAVRELGVEIPAADYEWSRNGEIERLAGGCWIKRYRAYQVALTHGFDRPPALMKALASAVATAAANPMGIPEVIGPFQFTGTGGAWIGEAGETVGRYTLPWSA